MFCQPVCFNYPIGLSAQQQQMTETLNCKAETTSVGYHYMQTTNSNYFVQITDMVFSIIIVRLHLELEIRSVERRGICPIATSTMNELFL